MSSVNDQVTDSVSQIHTLLTGGAPSQAMGMLDVTGTETIGMSMFNAVTAQQNSQTSAGAALNASCAKMLRTETVQLPETKSKQALEFELKKLQLAEEKIKSELAFKTIAELRKSNKSITQSSIFDAFGKALSQVETSIVAAEKPIFEAAVKSLKDRIDKIV
ncbi:RebB family R body protein [Shewanella abyssi]|uniref:RebB family R body protein n=1 Tax=Shewanella abyssi TaxID=311789 RepID=UPI00200E6CF0|nr:RebB family R body protein [Shewanella abyssi]MCL1051843.1 RebB family R body protein [Shewanella abyssi]